MAATQESIATTVQVTGVTPSDRTGIGYTPGTGGLSTGDSLVNHNAAALGNNNGTNLNQQQQQPNNTGALETSPNLRPATGATPLHSAAAGNAAPGANGHSDGPIRQPGINDSPHAKDQHSQQVAAAQQQQQQRTTATSTSSTSKYVPKRNSNAPPAQATAANTTANTTATNSAENKETSSDDVEVVGESRPTNPHAATSAPHQPHSQAASGKQVGRGSSSAYHLQPQQQQQHHHQDQQNKKKEKVQTKFSWGLHKDREPELLHQIEDLKKQVSDRDRMIAEMQEKQAVMELEIAKLQRQCKEQSEDRTDEEDRMQRLQTALRETMLKTAQAHRRDARRAQHDNHFELGQVVTTQTAVGAQEMWVYGNRYREILAEIEKNKQRLEDCESAKKDAENVKRTSSKKIGSGPMVVQPPHHVSAVPALTDNTTAEGGANLVGGGGFTHQNPQHHHDGEQHQQQQGGGPSATAFTHQLPAPDQQGAQISNGFVNPNDLGKNEKGVAINEHLDNYLYAEAQAEIHKLEVSYLKAEIERLHQEKSEIDVKRHSFLKECTRIQEEDRSVFCNTPAIGPSLVAPSSGPENMLGGGVVSTTTTTANTMIAGAATNGGKFSQGNRYILIHLLGKGGFSEVWKAFDIIEGRYVACKIHAVDPRWTREVRDNFFRHIHREFHIQRKIAHERVVKLYDVFSVDERSLNGGRGHAGSETSISVMEYCSGVDLDTKLKQQGTLKESEARLILKQMLAGLAALHAAGVIHYDLKPANILFTSDLGSCHEIKITDFGLSKQVSQEGNAGSNNPQIELTSQGTGTFWYLPPECFNQGKVSIDTGVDIWAVGVIFYQMLYGKKPFANNQSQKEIWHQNLISLQAKQGVDFPDTKNVSAEAKRFINLCLKENPRERPNAVVLGSDPYLTKKRGRPLLEQSTAAAGAPAAPFDERPPLAPNLRHRD